jgi:hypothetical protein
MFLYYHKLYDGEKKKNWTISKSNQDPLNQQRTDSEQRKMTNKNKGSYKKTPDSITLASGAGTAYLSGAPEFIPGF